jgi:hypothetical protein
VHVLSDRAESITAPVQVYRIKSALVSGATVGGLAGLTEMVGSQLRCPNPNGNHVLLWHSTRAAAGALGGLILGTVFAWTVSLIETRRSSVNGARIYSELLTFSFAIPFRCRFIREFDVTFPKP